MNKRMDFVVLDISRVFQKHAELYIQEGVDEPADPQLWFVGSRREKIVRHESFACCQNIRQHCNVYSYKTSD